MIGKRAAQLSPESMDGNEMWAILRGHRKGTAKNQPSQPKHQPSQLKYQPSQPKHQPQLPRPPPPFIAIVKMETILVFFLHNSINLN